MKSKKIGLVPAITIQTNAMIGAGVVAIPAVLAKKVGSLGLLSYAICIAIIFCMTFSLGKLSLKRGGEAWCYHFPKLWGNHFVGMLSSSCYILGVLVAMGFVAMQAGVWLHEMLPILNPQALCFLITALLATFVYAGKNVSTLWQYFYSAIIFLGITLTTIICFVHFDKTLFFREHEGDVLSTLKITPVLLFSFLGFESISSLYTIVKNPKRNVLLGGLIGLGCVSLLYVAFSSAIIGAIAPKYFSGCSLVSALSSALPQMQRLSNVIYLGGLFAIIGTLHAMIWSVSVLTIDVIKKSKTQKLATMPSSILFSTFVIMSSSLFLTSEAIMNLAVLFIAISYVLSISGLLKEKKLPLSSVVICFTGIFGGCLMCFFALLSLL